MQTVPWRRTSGVGNGRWSYSFSRACRAKRKGVIMSDILNVAGWSNEKTFARFYNKQARRKVFATGAANSGEGGS